MLVGINKMNGFRIKKKKTILYVPVIYRHDKGTYPPTLPSCWYYRIQRRLWNRFANNLTNYNVIWKAGPRTSNLEDPIKRLKADNIRYSTKKLNRELKKADLVLVDAITTPVKEAMDVGKKVFIVVFNWDSRYIREECREMVNFLFEV